MLPQFGSLIFACHLLDLRHLFCVQLEIESFWQPYIQRHLRLLANTSYCKLLKRVEMWPKFLSEIRSDRTLCNLARWLEVPMAVASADAIVALGGDSRRLTLAAKLFRQGLAPALWYTGQVKDSYTAQRVDEVTMRTGIPAKDITLLSSTSTWEDGEQITSLVIQQKVQTLVIVTSWYHGRRTRSVIEHHLRNKDVQVYYQLVPTSEYDTTNWWRSEEGYRQITREFLKVGYYWLYYGIHF